MKYRPLLLLLILLSSSVQAQFSCSDKDSSDDWNARIAKQPNDIELQTLHALWLGLCTKIFDDYYDQDAAHRIFEAQRQRAIERRQKQEEQQKERTEERGQAE